MLRGSAGGSSRRVTDWSKERGAPSASRLERSSRNHQDSRSVVAWSQGQDGGSVVIRSGVREFGARTEDLPHVPLCRCRSVGEVPFPRMAGLGLPILPMLVRLAPAERAGAPRPVRRVRSDVRTAQPSSSSASGRAVPGGASGRRAGSRATRFHAGRRLFDRRIPRCREGRSMGTDGHRGRCGRRSSRRGTDGAPGARRLRGGQLARSRHV